jgi:hypothetical protein
MECDMLSKEFAQEVAKEVFNMLEEKWAEKRNERAAAKAAEDERKAKERANRLPATARKMLEALQRVEGMAGGPVSELMWRDQVKLEIDGMTPTNLRTAFSRYREMMLASGRIRCENGKFSTVLTLPDEFDAQMMR